MPRLVLGEDNIHPAIREKVAGNHRETVDEVAAAVEAHAVVIVGMSMNPHPKRVKKALDSKSIPYMYLEYGGYLSQWRLRNALKMWTGWASLPICFVEKMLVGGADDILKLLDKGELDHLIKKAG